MGRPLIRRLAALAIAACLAVACRGTSGSPGWVAGREEVLVDLGARTMTAGTTLLDAGRGSMIAVWAEKSGIRALEIDRSWGHAADPEELSDVRASALAGLALPSGCGPGGERFVVVVTPERKDTEGNAEMLAIFLREGGKAGTTVAIPLVAGPYTTDVSLAGGCDGIAVGWGRGSVGDFAAVVAMLDPATGGVSWQRRMSADGANGFSPAIAVAGGRILAVWGEARLAFGSGDEDPSRGRLVTAVLDADGGWVRRPRPLATTTRPEVTPSIAQPAAEGGAGAAILFKDRPKDEFRTGIYLAFAKADGTLGGPPRRIGRADGPDEPLLISVGGGDMGTAVIRGLADDEFIGFNVLDRRGIKRGRELQIYAHGVRFRHVAFLEGPKGVTLLFFDQGRRKSRLCLARLEPA